MRICIVIVCWLLTTATAVSTERREIVGSKNLVDVLIRTEIYSLIDQLKSGRWSECLAQPSPTDLLARRCFAVRGTCCLLLSIYEREGLDRSMDALSQSSLAFLDALQCDYMECIASTFGYALICQRNLDDALRIFELNVEWHPESWKAYDNLGEAYEMKGDRHRAIECYKKSLELDPLNQAAQKALARLNSNSGEFRAPERSVGGQVLSRE